MERNTIECADVLDYLRGLPDNAVNCVITSPPYYGLRDYGVSGQIGLEATPAAYIARMVDVFHEVRRVLRDDGTCWLNIGDSYASGEVGRHDSVQGREIDGKRVTSKAIERQQSALDTGLPSKNLMLMPARVAIAMQDDGWYVRAEIIWHKVNPMPESVTDRPTKAHEMVYLLTKSPTYWYDQEAVREPAQDWGSRDRSNFRGGTSDPKLKHHGLTNGDFLSTGRNLRDVWSLPSEPTPFAHFATFPRALVERCLRAGCPSQTCAVCGAPWVREVEAIGGTIRSGAWVSHKYDLERGMSDSHPGLDRSIDKNGVPYQRIDKGFHPTCTHDAATLPGVVLDPFMGSGTTALVAREWGRDFVGCDLSPEYVKLANERLAVPYTPPLVIEA